MGNKATQPLSFNTIRRSQTKVRAKRRRTQNIVLLAMFATIALILVTLLVFGGFAIINAIIDARPNTPNNDNTPPLPVGTITFVQTTKSATDTLVGDLVLVNQDNKYTFPEAAEKSLVRIYDYRAKTADGKFCYNLVEQQYKLQASAIDSLNAMMQGDIPVIMTYNMFLAFLAVIGVLLADLMYAVVDPRVKLA